MRSRLNVVLFSGGRGSGALATELVRQGDVALTIAINGYDDGASTGEVRRFLGDSLGPSDFRKNASRMAAALRTSPDALIDLLDYRLPVGCARDGALDALAAVAAPPLRGTNAPAVAAVGALAAQLPAQARAGVADCLAAFERELRGSGRPFDFSDCSLGNLVFAGAFLQGSRDFNGANAAYCALLGLPDGLIENVTDGTNAFLVAIDRDGRLLGSEEEIVAANSQNRIRDIYLIDRVLDADERQRLAALDESARVRAIEGWQRAVRLNPRLRERIATAELVIYAAGTQHSSLFPSYLTPGLSAAIAGNLRAIKLLLTNIQSDAEIAGSSAVDLIERASYYLKEKGRLATPTPCLITHYLINDPGHTERDTPYVPLGRLDAIEDPRLVRIANYEDGVSGRHDAGRILAPFIESLAGRRRTQKVAVLLYGATSTNKLAQSLLEMVRGGIAETPVEVTALCDGGPPLDAAFAASLPFELRRLEPGPRAAGELADLLSREQFDYIVLFESSGMYRGEDIVGLVAPLAFGRLDAVWGSRRLSVRDIQESYRLRYRHNVVLGAISYLGSHVLSLAYLTLYGRYISDTLSGARAVRTAYFTAHPVDPTHKQANQRLLSGLLGSRAEVLETPVQFLSLSPERVRRTSPLEGLQALTAIALGRLRTPRRALRATDPARSDLRPAVRSAGDTRAPRE